MAEINGEQAAQKLKSRLAARAHEAARPHLRRDRRADHPPGAADGRGFATSPPWPPCAARESQRLAALAVPPAYVDVLYAADPSAHIQAIGRDAAGRLQYRYHPDWQRVREMRKARRLARLAEVLPQIRRASPVISAPASRPAPSRSRLSSISSRAAPYVRAASNMRGCAARAARRRCSSRTSRSTARPSRCASAPKAASGSRRRCMRRGLRPRSPCSGDCLAAASFNIAAKTACCAGQRARRQPLPARDRGRRNFAQGFPHAARFRRGARRARLRRAGDQQTRPAAAGARRRRRCRRPRQYAGDLRQELRARNGGECFRRRRARAVRRGAERARSSPANTASNCWRKRWPAWRRDTQNALGNQKKKRTPRKNALDDQIKTPATPISPPILQISFHSSSVTGCTERRGSCASIML